jgi:hypothetical protein
LISTVKTRLDAWANEAIPANNYGDKPRLKVSNTGGSRRWAYIFFTRPFPLGALVVSATLKLRLGAGWSGGPHVPTLRRISAKWKEAGPGGLNWNNKPAVAGAVITGTGISGGIDKQLVSIDVTSIVSEASAGNVWFGIRIEVDTTGSKDFYSAEAGDVDLRPVLEVTWSEPPDAPTELVPDGGAAVSIAKPVLGWKYTDEQGEYQTQFQVQISTVSDFSSTEYDSGWISSTAWQHDLGPTAYVGVSDGATRYWRVRVQDNFGQISVWSAAAQFQRQTKATLTITSPTTTVDDTSPTVSHTFVGRTQRSLQYIVEEWDGTKYVSKYNSGEVTTADTSFMIPEDIFIKEATNYRITLRAWDTILRVSTPGDASYVQQQVVVTYVRPATGGPAPVDTLIQIASTPNTSPEVITEFTRLVRPDFFAVRVNGTYVEGAQRLDPADIETTPGGSTYRYTLWGLRPKTAHTIEVEAVSLQTGKYRNSIGNPTLNVTPQPKNKWLLAPTINQKVCIISQSDPVVSIGEDGTTFFPIGGRSPVRITSSVRGYEGSIDGALAEYKGISAATWRDRFEQIKSHREKIPLRVVWEDMNIAVIIEEVSIVPSRKGWYEVGFDFRQIGDYTFVVE